MTSATQTWTAAPTGYPVPSFRPVLYLLISMLVAFAVTAFAEPTLSMGNATVLAPAGFICIGIYLWQVKTASVGLFRLIFALLAVHALVGYLLAASSVQWIATGTLDDRAFSLSFVVVASGLMVGAFAFHLTAPSRGWLPRVDSQRLVTVAKWMTLVAAAGIFYFHDKNQMLPWQFNILDMGEMRYQISGLDEWLMNRCSNVLMLTVPLLFLFKGTAKLFALIGFVGLAITFSRAPILAVILVVALSSVIRTGKLWKLGLTIGAAVALYALSQLVYAGFLQRNIDPESTYQSMASSLPEVRDLGWVLWLNGGDWQWGATLVQPVLPIPSVMSPWIRDHSLRSLTTSMIGHTWDEMGGLRITLAGEGYLNFGVVGAMALGGLWGWAMRKTSGVVKAASDSRAVVHAYFAALLVSWLAFWIHLGGSQASGAVRTMAVLLAVMFYICRTRTRLSS